MDKEIKTYLQELQDNNDTGVTEKRLLQISNDIQIEQCYLMVRIAEALEKLTERPKDKQEIEDDCDGYDDSEKDGINALQKAWKILVDSEKEVHKLKKEIKNKKKNAAGREQEQEKKCENCKYQNYAEIVFPCNECNWIKKEYKYWAPKDAADHEKVKAQEMTSKDTISHENNDNVCEDCRYNMSDTCMCSHCYNNDNFDPKV